MLKALLCLTNFWGCSEFLRWILNLFKHKWYELEELEVSVGACIYCWSLFNQMLDATHRGWCRGHTILCGSSCTKEAGLCASSSCGCSGRKGGVRLSFSVHPSVPSQLPQIILEAHKVRKVLWDHPPWANPENLSWFCWRSNIMIKAKVPRISLMIQKLAVKMEHIFNHIW